MSVVTLLCGPRGSREYGLSNHHALILSLYRSPIQPTMSMRFLANAFLVGSVVADRLLPRRILLAVAGVVVVDQQVLLLGGQGVGQFRRSGHARRFGPAGSCRARDAGRAAFAGRGPP